MTVEGFPLTTSKILTILGFDGSIKAKTSELIDKCLEFKNSTLSP